jgi:hypothetical protein
VSLPDEEMVAVEVRDSIDIIESVLLEEYIEELEYSENLSNWKDGTECAGDSLFLGGGEGPGKFCSCVEELNTSSDLFDAWFEFM